jgi:enoyl-[acyl-carrier-protein] reductase (NADH)
VNWAGARRQIARPKRKAAGVVKPCTPEAVGPALLYLAGQTAEGITGEVLHTDEFGKSWP